MNDEPTPNAPTRWCVRRGAILNATWRGDARAVVSFYPGSVDRQESGITHADVDGALTITLWGEVDAALRSQASQAMAAVMQTDSRVIAEASGVTFIDSSGLAFLLQLHRHCKQTGQGFVLVDPLPRLVELLDLLDVAGLIATESSHDARST